MSWLKLTLDSLAAASVIAAQPEADFETQQLPQLRKSLPDHIDVIARIYSPVTHGFCIFLLDTKTRTLVVAFSATSTIYYIAHDLDVRSLPWPYARDDGVRTSPIYVHRGFLRRYASLRPDMRKMLLHIIATVPINHILFVGHSLGAAMAEMAQVDLGRLVSSRAITIGSPAMATPNWHPIPSILRLYLPGDPVYTMLQFGTFDVGDAWWIERDADRRQLSLQPMKPPSTRDLVELPIRFGILALRKTHRTGDHHSLRYYQRYVQGVVNDLADGFTFDPVSAGRVFEDANTHEHESTHESDHTGMVMASS